MLSAILMQLGMRSLVFNPLVSLKKSLGMVWVPARLDTATKILKEKFKIQTLSS
jgi:hypothetical protein